MGNPHLACLTDVDLDGLDLTPPPAFDAALFPEGVNVELIDGARPGAHIRLRVHERGVGETRSCGTGAVRRRLRALAADGRTEGTVVVDVPGGRLSVQVDARTTVLTGPAVIVSAGALCAEWLAADAVRACRRGTRFVGRRLGLSPVRRCPRRGVRRGRCPGRVRRTGCAAG